VGRTQLINSVSKLRPWSVESEEWFCWSCWDDVSHRETFSLTGRTGLLDSRFTGALRLVPVARCDTARLWLGLYSSDGLPTLTSCTLQQYAFYEFREKKILTNFKQPTNFSTGFCVFCIYHFFVLGFISSILSQDIVAEKNISKMSYIVLSGQSKHSKKFNLNRLF